MGSIVSDWATVGEWAVVGEGAVVRQRQEIPAGRIAVGTPAKLLDKHVGEDFKAQWKGFKELYVDLARRYPAGLT
jgi:carbonic anhydrase/acetyltransferase-like protein (isoleucine patch superfamily)